MSRAAVNERPFLWACYIYNTHYKLNCKHNIISNKKANFQIKTFCIEEMPKISNCKH